ncbi:MAG: class I SAM-dependent methyltransferase [Bacteroidales bacterium]
MSTKQSITRILRQLGLMQMSDYLRFIWLRRKNRDHNRTFRKQYPEVALPPDYLMYEAFQLDYERYYINGKKTAEWLVSLVQNHKNLKGASILDWGCGPARVIRHLPGLIEDGNCYGTDYNRQSIAWCSANFTDIYFHSNDLMPGLIYEKEWFDLVYGISVFTHLSMEAHEAWLNELIRILKPGGILFITLHGNSFREKLTPSEKLLFDADELVIRGQVTEGHRTFTAFHPEKWVRIWTLRLTVLEHIRGAEGEQDVWIFRKILP